MLWPRGFTTKALQVIGLATTRALAAEGVSLVAGSLRVTAEFRGSASDDTFDGGDGTDTYVWDHGAGDVNTCISVESDPRGSCTP